MRQSVTKLREATRGAWSTGQVKLVAACLIYAKHEHCYQVDSLTLMMTSTQWIPLDHVYERELVDMLVGEERSFIKPLRYEASRASGFPNFQLLDAGARPVALDIMSAFLSDAERVAKLRAVARRDPKGWLWDTAQGSTPAGLPAKAPLPARH